jgi:hypothetical protein
MLARFKTLERVQQSHLGGECSSGLHDSGTVATAVWERPSLRPVSDQQVGCGLRAKRLLEEGDEYFGGGKEESGQIKCAPSGIRARISDQYGRRADPVCQELVGGRAKVLPRLWGCRLKAFSRLMKRMRLSETQGFRPVRSIGARLQVHRAVPGSATGLAQAHFLYPTKGTASR